MIYSNKSHKYNKKNGSIVSKNNIITLIVCLLCVNVFSQINNTPQRLKYITTGPDGNVAMTIYDDTRDDSMKLEAADTFYRFEILDTKTSEPIYSAKNNGKVCNIDKTKLDAGTYNLRLYTANFVITSKITIIATKKMYESLQSSRDIVATRE